MIINNTHLTDPIVNKSLPRLMSLSCKAELLLGLLILIAVVAASLLLGFMLTKIMTAKGFKNNMTANLCIAGLLPIAMCLRYGLSLELIQGIFLMFVLLYASWSDITSHTVDNYISVIILALSLVSIPTLGIGSMLLGAAIVVLPQIIMALIPSCKPLGGADLKMSAALAILLGWQRGIAAFILGLLFAVIFMTVYNRIKNANKGEEKPFALVPFLSASAMALFIFA